MWECPKETSDRGPDARVPSRHAWKSEAAGYFLTASRFSSIFTSLPTTSPPLSIVLLQVIP